NNYFYIDKTKFISDWWNGGISDTLIARPNGFGKSLTLDAINTFFSPKFAGRSDLFEGLEVWKDDKLRSLQGKIPVIFLSFAHISEDTYDKAVSKIKHTLTKVYESFIPAIDVDAIYISARSLYTSVCDSMDNVTAQSSLIHLCHFVKQQYNVKPIILLDSYDVPLEAAWLHGYWDDLAYFIGNFLCSSFKANFDKVGGIITGTAKIAHEEVFCSVNHLDIITTTSNRYTDSFGFTEEEVVSALDEYGLSLTNEVKEWYGGYRFGEEKEVYNPRSIVNYLKTQELAPNPLDNNFDKVIGRIFSAVYKHIEEKLKEIMQGKILTVKLDERLVFANLDADTRTIWSLLLSAGYIKALSCNYITKEYEVALTNHEAGLILEQKIPEWLKNDPKNLPRISKKYYRLF
ncbi:MAG: AAA family ATPase, partial [Desulfovibrionaceae bacterium]|nr:AAA family ATPase [Desulfovibrionaceae bacterium]